jgi:hypothetical protein
MKTMFAILAWLFVPTATDYHTHPGLFWVKAMLAGTLWAFVFMGVVGGAYFYFSSDFDDWNEDR